MVEIKHIGWRALLSSIINEHSKPRKAQIFPFILHGLSTFSFSLFFKLYLTRALHFTSYKMLIFALSELREDRNVLRNTQVSDSFYTTIEVKRTASHKRIASQKRKRELETGAMRMIKTQSDGDNNKMRHTQRYRKTMPKDAQNKVNTTLNTAVRNGGAHPTAAYKSQTML